MLALASGGHIRDFIRLAKDSAGRFGSAITKDHARAAINQMIDLYDLLYDADFHAALVNVNRNRMLPAGPYDNAIVDRLLVLPYRNSQSWYALHPCVLNGPRFTSNKRSKSARTKVGNAKEKKR